MNKNNCYMIHLTKKIGVLFGILICLIPEATIGQAIIGGDWREDVKSYAQKLIDEDLSPGMGIAVAQGDWVVFCCGVGAADLQTGRPVTNATRFYIASTTKSFTALAVVLAAHRGKIDLDKPMTHYLPTVKLPKGVSKDAITVWNLLTMSNGLSGSGPIVFRTAYSGVFTQAQLLELLRYHEPTGKIGTFDYNNLGYNLLGLILETRLGDSWKKIVRRYVLMPLKMEQTTAYRSQLTHDQIALPHFPLKGWPRTYLAKDDANLHAAGGHFATACDLARYVAAHLSGGILEGNRALPKQPVLETHKKQIDQDRDFGPFLRFGWGYGWDLGTYKGDTLLHRFGGFTGYHSHVSFMPEHGIGVVVLVNGFGIASRSAQLMATYIYDRLLSKEGLEKKYSRRLENLKTKALEVLQNLSEHMTERRVRLEPLPHPLIDYTGVYENTKLGQMEWRLLADGLEVKKGVMWSRAEVYNAKKNQLRVELRGGGEVVEFMFPKASGKAQSLHYNGEEFQRKRR